MKYASLICVLMFSLNTYANGFLPIANIVKINGTALINNEEVQVGAEVAKGMEIKIPKKGDYIVVKFQNGHKVRFTEATVKIEELTEKVSLISLLKGQVHTFVKKLMPEEKFTIKTKYASFGVRGTKFGISLDESKKEAYLCVCEGIVQTTQGNKSVDVLKDEDLWVGANAKKLEAKKATAMMVNMTSQIIEEFEQL